MLRVNKIDNGSFRNETINKMEEQYGMEKERLKKNKHETWVHDIISIVNSSIQIMWCINAVAVAAYLNLVRSLEQMKQ